MKTVIQGVFGQDLKLRALLDHKGDTFLTEDVDTTVCSSRGGEDIAHALDADCSMLFQRMQGRHR